MAGELNFEQPLTELKAKIDQLRRFSVDNRMDFSEEIARLEAKYAELENELYGSLTVHQKLQIIKAPNRPTTVDYVSQVFTDFIELHGDRTFADDLSVVGGLAKLNGVPVTVIGTEKGKDTKDKLARNFGMPHPEGYRKALRLMQQADKFRRPIVTFIDVSGAFPGVAAEERGQSEAIARNLREMASFRVPIVCVIIGEGGSGGALALGVGNRVLMLEHAIYSVISPEGAAAIIYKDASRAMETAENMKITAEHIKALGVADDIVPEPRGGAHRDPAKQAELVRERVWAHLQELMKLSGDELVEDRFRKFRSLGQVGFASPAGPA
ncbi:acetyl-CoA carboxylase carboxyltransferase subunit alpha [Paenibacillus cymbidii]|uniref:acetyl-CoA carboxylase carboxyltransferase subunit alpha n=1 Tax=Paenibacillus cymbidii TaxID=1639034 RepID=UPI001081778F|nr:acetyl-CoA carboxylase carboxyltransferase subunit alpha [Paenibacillus cymbidii]